ncbi:hypothetical protein MAR_005053, partial [Mya arenaria]
MNEDLKKAVLYWFLVEECLYTWVEDINIHRTLEVMTVSILSNHSDDASFDQFWDVLDNKLDTLDVGEPTAPKEREYAKGASVVQLSPSGTGNASVNHIGNAFVNHMGNASVNHIGNACFNHMGNACINHIGNACFNHMGNACINHIGNACINHIGNACINHMGNACINHIVNACFNRMGNASVNHIGNACVNHMGNASVNHIAIENDFSNIQWMLTICQ